MPQLDKELFIDYIFYILLVLVHLYTGSQINKNVLRIYGRNFLITNFLNYERLYKRESFIIKKIFTNVFNNFKSNI